MSEFDTRNDMQNENVQNTPDVQNNQQSAAPETPKPSYQSSAYSYGRFGSEPIPDATRSGYYTAPQQSQPEQGYAQQPQQSYSQPQQNYSQPSGGYYTSPSGQSPAPQKPPKKERRGLRTFLTAGIAAVTTAAVLLSVLWGVGVFSRQMPVEGSGTSSSMTESSSSAQSSSESTGPAPDAFTINPAPNDTSTVNADGSMTPAAVAAKVKSSVVCIENFSDTDGNTLAGEGSGIIFKTSGNEGYIITNAHVVADAASLKIVLVDGSTYDAYLVGSDTNTDLAVIRAVVDDQTLTPAEFGDASALQQGDYVLALGNPGGMAFSNSVTFGVVSAVNRQVQTKNGYTMSCIQTDAAINPGNSGGALVNMRGEVVGINSSKIVASGYEGLGFAISINEALPIVSDLMEYGYVKDRAYLGITYQFIDETTARMYGLPTGVYIARFTTDTVSSAGCKVGDIITHADGEELTSSSVLIDLLSQKKPGDTMTFTVYRSADRSTGYSTFDVTVTLGEYTPSQSQMIG